MLYKVTDIKPQKNQKYKHKRLRIC